MHKRVETINEYYANLEYQSNRKETKEKLLNLCKTLNFKETDKLSYRFFYTASLMKNNLKTFASVCEHIDVVITIIDFFNYVGATIEINDKHVTHMADLNLSVIFTIGYMYQEHEMHKFLETAIIKESQMEIYTIRKKQIRLYIDMILLEDSDLYAVVNCLKFRSVISVVRTIWIQESIKQTFVWYFKKYFEYDQNFVYIFIQTFRSKQDLFSNISGWKLNDINTVTIVSIWSENITAAKNLAESFKHDILCINTCMNFDAGVIFSYVNANMKSLDFCLHLHEAKEYTCTNPINPITHQDVMFDLFYDGKWQTPIKKEYCMHNNILFANATREDIVKCATSAKDGFEIWSAMSIKSRLNILLNLANILENEGNFLVGMAITKSLFFSYIFESQVNYSYVNEKVEITKICMQRGTVILKEAERMNLFVELTITLLFGNSVIVICDPDLCILAQYCNMFKMCGIPPGVINLLSGENIDFKYDVIMDNTLTKLYSAVSVTQHMIVARQ